MTSLAATWIMAVTPQPYLRRENGFDAAVIARQSIGMRLPMLVLVMAGLVWGPVWAARPMKWDSLQLLRSAAEKGDAEAQYLLGLQYREGDGVDRSPVEAERWLRRAAEAGRVDAQTELGVLQSASSEAGKREEAARWLLSAARQGDAGAMQALGELYRGNPGLSGDPMAALRWYVQAAAAGRAVAARAVAELYVFGQGVARDLVLALHWYGRAAELGDEPAKLLLARVESITEAIANDPQPALPWWRNEAAKGDASALLALGRLEARQRAPQEEPEEAARWAALLASLRGAEAHMVRGFLLEHGLGVNRDLDAAIAEYRRAAVLGLEQGKEAVARLEAAAAQRKAEVAPSKSRAPGL